MKSLAEKLNYKEGMAIRIDGQKIYEIPELQIPNSQNSDRPDFILLITENSQELESRMNVIQQLLHETVVFWVAYPKRGSGTSSDLHREKLWELLKAYGLRPVSQVALNDRWTALRFKPGTFADTSGHKEKPLPAVPLEMFTFLEAEGLLEEFHRMSKSHQREYIMAFLEAKKPETKQRRLIQMAEKLRTDKK